MSTSANRRVQASTLDRAIEATWLTCAALVPLVILPDTWMVGFVQVPKVFLLRTAAILLVVLMTLRWASEPRSSTPREGSSIAELRASATVGVDYLRTHPIMLAAAAVVGANLISLLFSPMRAVSLGGVDPGWDGYSLASVASYVVLFVAVATNMRSVAQVRRLLWALTISSLILSMYGAGQYLGFDLFRKEWDRDARIWLTFGNPTFGAAYLLMTIPLTLGLWQGWQERFSPLIHVAVGVALVMPQVMALVLTLSRAATGGLVVSLVVFIALSAWTFGRRRAKRPGVILAAGLGLALVGSFLPVPGVPSIRSEITDRLSTIGATLASPADNLGNRNLVWGYSATAWRFVPWANTEVFPEIPNLSLAPLRRLVGYGPDLFRYAIGYASSPVDRPDGPGAWQHAHNFLIHSGVELGLLGVLAYLSLFGAVALALYRALREARLRAVPDTLGYITIGLAAVMAGRALEQMMGKAQISDLALSWILAGVVFAIVEIRARSLAPEGAPAGAGSVGAKRPRVARPSRARRNIATNVVVGLIVLAAIVVWSQTVAGTARSSVLLGDALQPISGSDTRSVMERAIAMAPEDVAPRLLFARSLLNGAKGEDDHGLKLTLLRDAERALARVLDRNPMEYRARATAAEISARMMLLKESVIPTAIRNAEIAVALSPSLWKPREFLGETLFSVSRLDEAEDVLAEAWELGASRSNSGYYVLYLRTRISIERGDVEAAASGIEAFAKLHDAMRLWPEAFESLVESLDAEFEKIAD